MRMLDGGVVLLCLVGTAMVQIPGASAEIVVEKWQVAGPFLAPHSWRNSNIDYLILHGGEAAITPSPFQVFYAEQTDRGEV